MLETYESGSFKLEFWCLVSRLYSRKSGATPIGGDGDEHDSCSRSLREPSDRR